MAGKIKTLFYMAVAGGAGYAFAHFYDPEMGRTRRSKTADQAAARARRAVDQARKEGVQVTDRIEGRMAEAARSVVPDAPPNDPTLQHKVESEVLGDPRFTKGTLNVNAEDGRVVLRGTLDRAELINELEMSVRQIDGVREVANLVHLPGQQAPETR